MADMKYDIDVSEVVQARREIQKWAKDNSEAFNVVNSRMRTMGKTSELAFNQFGRSASRAQTKWKRFSSVGLQQAGYQIGDFAVQLQGGTNAAVAFGQQGSQLAGIFGPAGAIAGAGIAITTAFVAPLLDANKAAKELKTSMDSLETSISSAKQALEIHQMSVIELTDKYGLLGLAVRESSLAIARADFNAVAADIRDQTIPALDELAEAFNLQQSTELFSFESNQAAKALKEVGENLKLTSVQVDDLARAYDTFDTARTFDDQLNAVLGLKDAMADIPPEVLAADKELNAAFKTINQMVEQGAELQRTMDKVEDAAPGANWMDNAITGMNSLIQRIMVGVAGVKALKREAIDLEGPSYTFDPVSGKYKESGDSSTFEERLAERMGLDLGTGTLGSPGSKRKGSGSGAGGSGVDERQRMLDSVNQLISSYDKEYEKALKVKEATKLIADAQRLGAIPANMEANEVLKDYIASLEETKNPMADFVNNSANQMANAFTSLVEGSKSASDAFRDMARSIIKQAFEMAVVNPIINGIFGGSSSFIKLPTFANGAAFSGGRVTAFADGGVVSKPTMFPMANGAGLMGEAGPEAIMPLKRGKGGKLGVAAEGGSSGPVTVNNHFHIAANGDDSVRRIIQSEAPKISAMTEKQIINSRRRGGSMKQAFG